MSTVATGICFVAPAAPAAARDTTSPTAAAPPSPEQEASDTAAATGQPVEVLAERREDAQLFANPDGTFTREITSGPQRVQLADGAWTGIDPTLERRPDGSIGPKAAAVDLSFSGGGTAPLVSLREEGKAISLSWAGALPPPSLDGDTATYAEVLPSVDLKVSASATGYSYVLVVKTAQAAENPALEEVRMAAQAEGVTLRTGAGGGLVAVDRTGQTVFQGGTPTMWDSSGEAAVSAGTPTASPASGEDVTPADPSADASPGDQVADVDVSVASGAVTLVPDTELLHSEDTVFPLYIDPDATVSRTDWLYVSSNWPTTEYYKFSEDKGVGRCATSGSIVCSSDPYTNRMYFKFTPQASDWAGTYVTKVRFRAYETWSFTCSASWVKVNLVDAAKVNSSTNWNNKPANGDQMGDRKVAYGRGSSCDPDAPASWVEFSDNAEETDENMTPTVRTKLAAGDPIAFALSASDESDANSWKRFRGDNAALSVTYDNRPAKPTNPRTTSPTTTCVTGAARPFINDNSPMLHVSAYDKDNQNLTATFELYDGSTLVKTVNDGPKADNSDFYAQLSGLTHGHVYKWRAKTHDGIYVSNGWSDWCEFAIDTERPDAKPSVSSTAFPAEEWGLKAGETGKFVFGSNGVTDSVYGNDVNYYEYAISNDNPTNRSSDPATLGADGEATFAPSTFGPNVLYVRSVDRAGNRGDTTRYVFKAARPCDDPAAVTCAAAVYQFDEGTGTTAADASGKGRTLTLTGPAWTAGRTGAGGTDKAVRLDGTDDEATAVPAIDTRQAFTVSAWVKLDNLTESAGVVSQSGTYGSGFSLQYWKWTGKWVFMRLRTDKTGPAAEDMARAWSVNPPEIGKWTHLAGTYNPNTGDMTLYVNGEAQETVKYQPPAMWNATDKLRIGHTRWNGSPVDHLPGDIDDVRVYPGLLDSSDIFLLSR